MNRIFSTPFDPNKSAFLIECVFYGRHYIYQLLLMEDYKTMKYRCGGSLRVWPVRPVQKKWRERAGNEGILKLTVWNSEHKGPEQCQDP
jgi:hypothetical protein